MGGGSVQNPLKSKRASRGRGLKHLENLTPHVYGTDWRAPPEPPKGWNKPLLGGRLPSAAELIRRLADFADFAIPNGLLLISAVLVWYIWSGREVSAWLWLGIIPVIMALPYAIWLAWRLISAIIRTIINIPSCLSMMWHAFCYIIVLFLKR